MNDKTYDHHWSPWAYVDIFTAGRLVFASQFYDAEGAQCVKCGKVVEFWVRKQWEDDGELETRQTGESWKTLSKTGCSEKEWKSIVIAETA